MSSGASSSGDFFVDTYIRTSCLAVVGVRKLSKEAQAEPAWEAFCMSFNADLWKALREFGMSTSTCMEVLDDLGAARLLM
jgi:hypothetical protein